MEISVVIPLFNKEGFVLAAIRSALAQTLPPREVVVVDDGSTDGGATIVAGLGNPRVVLLSQRNAGVSAARNAGCHAARAPWIAFLDADDTWDPEHLATLRQAVDREPAADLFGSGYREIWPDGATREVRPATPVLGRIPDFFRASAYMPVFFTSSILVRHAALAAAGGFPVGITHGEDLDTWARLALRNAPVYAGGVTVNYSQGVTGQATSRRASAPPILTTLVAALGQSGLDPQIRRDVRYYLQVNLPCYLQARRITAGDFCARVQELQLAPFGLPAAVWRLAARQKWLFPFVTFLVNLRAMVLKRRWLAQVLLVSPAQTLRREKR